VPAQECAQGGPLTAHVSERWASPQPSGLILSEDEARYLFRVRRAALLAASACLSRVSSPTNHAHCSPRGPACFLQVRLQLLFSEVRPACPFVVKRRSCRCRHAAQVCVKPLLFSNLPYPAGRITFCCWCRIAR